MVAKTHPSLDQLETRVYAFACDLPRLREAHPDSETFQSACRRIAGEILAAAAHEETIGREVFALISHVLAGAGVMPSKPGV